MNRPPLEQYRGILADPDCCLAPLSLDELRDLVNYTQSVEKDRAEMVLKSYRPELKAMKAPRRKKAGT